MIVSFTMVKEAYTARAKAMKLQSEGYTMLDSTNAGMSLGFATGYLVIAVVFLMLELLVLFYCVGIAYSCSKSAPERIVNVVLAITFTLPYALLNMVFVPCARKTLGSF